MAASAQRNTERVAGLSDDVGTRSIHNGSLQRERQRWLKARARCIRNGGGSDCMDKGDGDGSTTEAVGASAEGTTTEAAVAVSGTAAHPQSRATAAVVDRNSKNAGSGDGSSGGGGGNAGSRIGAGAGGSRLLTAGGNAREFPPRSRNSDANSNPYSSPSLRKGRGDGFVTPPPPAGTQDERKHHPLPLPGIERNHHDVEVKVEVPAGKAEVARMLGESAGLPGQEAVNEAERKTVEVDEAGGGGGGGDVMELPLEERLSRLEAGITLWGGTYVPPIAPDEKQRLIQRWTASAEGSGGNGPATATATVGGEVDRWVRRAAAADSPDMSGPCYALFLFPLLNLRPLFLFVPPAWKNISCSRFSGKPVCYLRAPVVHLV